MRLRKLLALLAAVSVAAMAVVTFLLPDPPEIRNRATFGPAAGSKRDPTRPPSPSERPSAALEIHVRETDGRDAEGIALRLESVLGPHLDGFDLTEDQGIRLAATTNERGRARFEALPVGPFAIVAESDDGRRVRHEFVLALERTAAEVVLPADPEPRDFLVRLIDPDGSPVAAAHVEIFDGAGSEIPATAARPALEGTSDEEGIARFRDVEIEGGVILAADRDGRAGLVEIPGDDLVVTLSDPGVLEGAMVGFPPERFLEARVIAATHGVAVFTPIVDGRYRFDGLPAGTWTLALSDPGGGRLVLPPIRAGSTTGPNPFDPIEVVVRAGETLVRDLEVADGGSIDGTVLTEKGDAVDGALVRATYAPLAPEVQGGPTLHGVHVWRFDAREQNPTARSQTHSSARTDSGGRYRLLGLQPGQHRIEVLASGLSYDRREGVPIEEGKRTNLEHILEPAGAIQGVEPRAGYLGLAREGRDEMLMIAVLPEEGGFTFAGLAPGSYSLSQLHPDPAIPRVPLATVAVESGRTTWIDLSRAERPVRLLGRVLDKNGGVAGVRVRIHPETLTTDTQGRYAMRAPYPLSGRISVQVLRDAVETWFSLPGTPDGATSFERDLRLGDESIRVRTGDEDGAPIPARLEISVAQLDAAAGDVETIRFESIFVDETGERAIEGLLPGEYIVQARFENGSEIRGAVSLPGTEVLELRRPPSSVLMVLVREPGGQPALRRWISVETWIDGRAPDRSEGASREPLWRWGETDVDGRATFRGVRAGEVLIRIRSARGSGTGLDRVLTEERVTLAADEEKSIELELPAN